MAHQHPPRFLKIVDDAKTRVREINVEQVKKKLDRGEKFVLVDVREESEFAKDHLPTAIHLGKGIIERDIEARVPDLAADIHSPKDEAVLSSQTRPRVNRNSRFDKHGLTYL
jgi:rhodanese-related sulfurtransferase